MKLLENSCVFELGEFPNLANLIDFKFNIPTVHFFNKISSILQDSGLPVEQVNLEYYYINEQNIPQSYFIVSFPNVRLYKKSDFLPSLAIEPLFETTITMPLEVLYPTDKMDAERTYAIPSFVNEREFKLPEPSFLSLLYEVYGNKNTPILKILLSDKDYVAFEVKLKPDYLILKEVDLREELPLIDKGWLKILEKENAIRFFGNIFEGKFKVRFENNLFVLEKIAGKQPSTTWEINEPYSPLPAAFPARFSGDEGLYLQMWPFQWARYPGDNLRSSLIDILKSLDVDLEEFKDGKKELVKVKLTKEDLRNLLEQLSKESCVLYDLYKNWFSNKLPYSKFFKLALRNFNTFYRQSKNRLTSFGKNINLLLRIADEKDMTGLTDTQKRQFYDEIRRLKMELEQKGLKDEDLEAELLRTICHRFPSIKDNTVYLAVKKIMKEAQTYSDKEQPYLYPDDFDVGIFPHHDFPEHSTDVQWSKPFTLDLLTPIDYALPTGGAYLISLPAGDQFIVTKEDLEEFIKGKPLKLKRFKKRKKAAVESAEELAQKMEEIIYSLAEKEKIFEKVKKEPFLGQRYSEFFEGVKEDKFIIDIEGKKVKGIIISTEITPITDWKERKRTYKIFIKNVVGSSFLDVYSFEVIVYASLEPLEIMEIFGRADGWEFYISGFKEQLTYINDYITSIKRNFMLESERYFEATGRTGIKYTLRDLEAQLLFSIDKKSFGHKVILDDLRVEIWEKLVLDVFKIHLAEEKIETSEDEIKRALEFAHITKPGDRYKFKEDYFKKYYPLLWKKIEHVTRGFVPIEHPKYEGVYIYRDAARNEVHIGIM